MSARQLAKVLRKAESAPAPSKVDPDVVSAIQSLADDTEEVSAFLQNLQEIDPKRTAVYASVIQSKFKPLWKGLKQIVAEQVEQEQALGSDEDELAKIEEIQQSLDQLEDMELDESGEGAGEALAQDEEAPAEEEAAQADGEEEAAKPEESAEGEGEEDIAAEPVVAPEELEEMAEGAALDMVLFNKTSRDPHWSIFANGKPLAEIRLADQDNPEEIRDVFVSEDYPKHVTEACTSSMGVKTTLDSLKARYYHAIVNAGAVATEAREAASKAMEDQYATRLASLKEDLLNTINLAIMASNKGAKGLFITNSLKQDVVALMRQAGVVNAGQAVSEIWVEACQKYMQDVLKTAEKWLAYSPEAMGEVTAEIMENAPEADGEEDLEEEDKVEEATASVQRRMASAVRRGGMVNVPIRTATAQPHGTEDYRSHVKTVATQLSRRMGRR